MTSSEPRHLFYCPYCQATMCASLHDILFVYHSGWICHQCGETSEFRADPTNLRLTRINRAE